jgi:glycosidase
MVSLGVDAVYLCPVFESDRHGYDTRDFSKIDGRLGTNQDFARVCQKLHEAGIRVVLDGVFNHVGRGFWAFKDVLQNREHSQYKDWFHIDWNRQGQPGDSFWYEGWEGHYELVKLNLHNQAVREHIFACVAGWVQQFGIDGLRLDVAYMLDHGFLRALRGFAKSLQPDFFLLGEAIHGDYNQIVNPEMLDSCTNYECYKGVYSSLNDANMFEIAYSLNRQFGPEHWTLYRGKRLLSFLDNHDVTRIASMLTESANLQAAYGLLFGMPGIPCVYYGSEWGERAEKKQGDNALRPSFERPQANGLTDWIRTLARIRAECPALRHGGYRQLYLTNRQLGFEREANGSRAIVAINLEAAAHVTNVLPTSGRMFDLAAGQYVRFDGRLELKPNAAMLFRCD